MKRSFGQFFAAAALVGTIGGLAAPAKAETDADLSKYCRTNYPNSTPVKRAPSGVIAHYCNQGGTPQGIDLARACELTTGSRLYRQLGDRILCADGPGPAQAASGEQLEAGDFVRYCREKFPNSTYQATPGNFVGGHSCRRVGGPIGFILQPIDLADACRHLKGTDEYRKEGRRVACVTGAGRQTAERRAMPAGGDGGNPSNVDTTRPPGFGNSDKDSPDGNKRAETSRPDDKRASDGRPTGTWQMTAGVLPGMKVRFDWSGGKMTGTIVELPAAAARTAKSHYDLSVGGVVMVGTFADGNLKLRTRLGVVGSRPWVQNYCPKNLPWFDKQVADRWTLPGWYPVYQMTRQDGRIKGRHGGIELIAPKRFQTGRCILYSDPFNPDSEVYRKWSRLQLVGGGIRSQVEVDSAIQLPKWAVKFELAKVE